MLQTITLSTPTCPLYLQASKEEKRFDFRDVCSSSGEIPALFNRLPEELVDHALHTLQDAGVELIEWRSLLYRRMGVPVLIKDYHYLVRDEDLHAASDILLHEGLPLSSPPPLLIETGGDFYTQGHMHRLTPSSSVGLAQHLVLYPSSFASYIPSELSPAPSLIPLASPLCKSILVPRQSAVYASILRMMQRYPRWSSTRSTLETHLSELIGYNLYDLQDGYVDVDDEESCQALEVDRRVEDAVEIVRGWNHTGVWRVGEEWMGDALAAVVKGPGDIDS
ncbi:hypothetical protein SCP_1801450 [Sparassis crispa]|uniref:Uncharacterized protein n=1 Tax=Sparassis crispa TaxID=139825 RepID=A0A401H6W3_9APHY|nr:hypothetical protein SCP_1801450 [Sparassis crispa]GBE90121.1 hypothetical protein SCP_1801450 [Sparassis crispa]